MCQKGILGFLVSLFIFMSCQGLLDRAEDAIHQIVGNGNYIHESDGSASFWGRSPADRSGSLTAFDGSYRGWWSYRTNAGTDERGRWWLEISRGRVIASIHYQNEEVFYLGGEIDAGGYLTVRGFLNEEERIITAQIVDERGEYTLGGVSWSDGNGRVPEQFTTEQFVAGSTTPSPVLLPASRVLEVVDSTDSSLTVEWHPSPSSAQEYEVWVSKDVVNTYNVYHGFGMLSNSYMLGRIREQDHLTERGTVRHTFGDLQAGTTYYIMVQALRERPNYGGYNSSGYYGVLTASTTRKLPKPSLSVVGGYHSLHLSWDRGQDESTDNGGIYEVWWRSTSDNKQGKMEVMRTKAGYLLNGALQDNYHTIARLRRSETYAIKVKALARGKRGFTDSVYSNEVIATTTLTTPTLRP